MNDDNDDNVKEIEMQLHADGDVSGGAPISGGAESGGSLPPAPQQSTAAGSTPQQQPTVPAQNPTVQDSGNSADKAAADTEGKYQEPFKINNRQVGIAKDPRTGRNTLHFIRPEPAPQPPAQQIVTPPVQQQPPAFPNFPNPYQPAQSTQPLFSNQQPAVNPAQQVQQPAQTVQSQPNPAPEPAPGQNPQAIITQPQQPAAQTGGIFGQDKAQYTGPQLLQAIESGNVDESRIPYELVIPYAEYKQRNAVRQQPVTNPAQQPPQQQQVADQAEEVKFYAKVNEIARQQAMNTFGWKSEDDIAAAEYSEDPNEAKKFNAFQAAIHANTQMIINRVQAEQQRRNAAAAEQQRVMNNIVAKVQELQQSEPYWHEIDVAMESAYKNMPYDKAVQYADAIQALKNKTITDQQAETLLKYYQEVRLNVIAAKNKLNVIPQPQPTAPVVETPGNGQTAPSNTLQDLMQATNYKDRQNILGSIIMARRAASAK